MSGLGGVNNHIGTGGVPGQKIQEAPKTTTSDQTQIKKYTNGNSGVEKVRSDFNGYAKIAKASFFLSGVAACVLACKVFLGAGLAATMATPVGWGLAGAAIIGIGIGLIAMKIRHERMKDAGQETDTAKELGKGALCFVGGVAVVAVIVAVGLSLFSGGGGGVDAAVTALGSSGGSSKPKNELRKME